MRNSAILISPVFPLSFSLNKTNHHPVLLPEILLISSYPPRECGIATYSLDLVNALNTKFNKSFKLSICPVESETEQHVYLHDSPYRLNTSVEEAFTELASKINLSSMISLVVVQHEFGFFEKKQLQFEQFLKTTQKRIILVFHTVLPNPSETLYLHVKTISGYVESIVVMTNRSRQILMEEYGINPHKIDVIPHGTHLVTHPDKPTLKNKFRLSGKLILSTFGLLSSGKSIETTLDSLPAIIKNNKDVLFLIIGKTHPTVVKQQGEIYRQMLETKIENLGLGEHVLFINKFLELPELLEYLQLTDVYLFTSKDPNQAVSGTFSYAMSSGCPVISTPIPHTREVLQNNAGISFDFGNSEQLAEKVNALLDDEILRNQISSNGLHYMAATAWENTAILHANLFKKMSPRKISLHYKLPPINMVHIQKLTTEFGMIQFSKLSTPDITSGYTLDDNARALIAMCQHYEHTQDKTDLKYIAIYLDFIGYCNYSGGHFNNYVNEERLFTAQNGEVNLADAKGRTVWALGYLIYLSAILPKELVSKAGDIFDASLENMNKIHSPRAMAFIIKGLYYANVKHRSEASSALITTFANRLVQMYRHEADEDWQWFESYLTYGNSILPEALLCAWLDTGITTYIEIAETSFDFLLSRTFTTKGLHLISNKGWLHKGEENTRVTKGGEQAIDATYTILALDRFFRILKKKDYAVKIQLAFEWFLGNNQLNQIIYNPRTGGCYDGLEEHNVNLNQGAESTVSYLMARLTIEKSLRDPNIKQRPALSLHI